MGRETREENNKLVDIDVNCSNFTVSRQLMNSCSPSSSTGLDNLAVDSIADTKLHLLHFSENSSLSGSKNRIL